MFSLCLCTLLLEICLSKREKMRNTTLIPFYVKHMKRKWQINNFNSIQFDLIVSPHAFVSLTSSCPLKPLCVLTPLPPQFSNDNSLKDFSWPHETFLVLVVFYYQVSPPSQHAIQTLPFLAVLPVQRNLQF